MRFCLHSILPIVILILGACGEDQIPVPKDDPISSLKWVESNIPPLNAITIMQLEVLDETLYALGSDDHGLISIYRYEEQWQKLASLEDGNYPLSNSYDFSFFKGVPYFMSFNKLYKIIDNKLVEILISKFILDIEFYNDKLFISGEDIFLNENKYSILSFDGISFTPISSEFIIGNIFKTKDRLYFQGFPGFELSGNDISPILFNGYFSFVDDEKYIYKADGYKQLISAYKSKNGTEEKVGNTINTEFNYNTTPRIIAFHDTFVMILNGSDLVSSVSYSLENDMWRELEATSQINSVVTFKERIIAYTQTGKILELVLK